MMIRVVRAHLPPFVGNRGEQDREKLVLLQRIILNAGLGTSIQPHQERE
jgi:hypothetical protein